MAFCAHAILDPPLFEISDATQDERFRDNPLVRDDPRIRFYAGVPLITGEGFALGTLCVIDRKPRTLTQEQKDALKAVAEAVVEQFEARRALLRLFDSSYTEIYHVDLAKKQIVFASEGARRNLGYSLAELRHMPVHVLMPEMRDAEKARAALEPLASEKGTVTLDTVARRKDGTTYPVELRIERLKIAGSSLAFATGVDLTERKRSEQQIQLLTAAIESGYDGVMIGRPGHSGGVEIVYVNETFALQMGYSREALVGQNTNIFVGPRTDREKLAALREVYRAGNAVKSEFVVYRRDGTYLWASESVRPLVAPDGTVTHIIMIQRDSTEDVLREMALAMQNEKLTLLTSVARALFAALEPRALVAALRVGVDQLTRGSATLYAALADGTFAPTSDMSSLDDTPVHDDLLARAATSPLPESDVSARRIVASIAGRATDSRFVIDVSVPGDTAISNADVFAVGALAQFVAVAIRNVELYHEVEERRAAVVELNQLKTDLIAMLAHDFRGPLTTIVGYAQLLAENQAFSAEEREFLETIEESAMRLAHLATDTLSLAHLEQNDLSLRIALVDVGEVVRDVASGHANSGRTIESVVPAEPFAVHADGARLAQVFENLIGNALKYSPNGAPVTVAVGRSGDEIEVAVTDRGIGVPESERANLFARFARASNARKLGITGTGFGLYLAKTIVEQHGGRILLESQEGHGSTFRVFLPTASVVTDAPRRAAVRTLVLDAQGEARSFLAHALRAANYAVRVVTDVDTAVLALEQQPFELAILELGALGATFWDRLPLVARRDVAFVAVGNFPSAAPAQWDAVVPRPFLVHDLEVAIARGLAAAARRVAGSLSA